MFFGDNTGENIRENFPKNPATYPQYNIIIYQFCSENGVQILLSATRFTILAPPYENLMTTRLPTCMKLANYMKN